MHKSSKKAVAAALLANLLIASSKMVAFAFTGAASMLAEAFHSLADTGNQGLLLVGGRQARREPDAAHPFGYGPARYFWAFVVAMVLFSLGGLFAIYEGVEKLRHPHTLDSVGWAIGVLAIAIVLEGASLRTAVGVASPLRRGRGWPGFVRHTKNPELPVVLMEDTGALLGLVLALTGILLAEVTGNARFDAAGSLGIGALLVLMAAVLAVEMQSLLIGEAADPEDVDLITAAIEGHGDVRRLIHLRTQHLGPDEVIVAAKVELDSELTVARLAVVIDEVESSIRAALPAARLIFLEPDVYNARLERGAGTR